MSQNIIKIETRPLKEEDYDQTIEIEVNKRNDTFYLIFSVITGILLLLVGGAFTVWTSPAILILKRNDTQTNPLGRPITTLEISMLTGIPILTAIFGSLIFPPLADKIGRKLSLMVIGLAMCLGGIGLAFSSSIPLMLTFFILLGICLRGCVAVLAIYVTEISEDHNRARYGCLMVGFFPLGQMYTYLIGPLFNLRQLTLLLAAPLIIFFMFIGFIPESPMFSLSNNNIEECIKSLKKLRSNKTDAEIDVDLYKMKKGLYGSEVEKKTNFLTVFKSKQGRIGLCLGLLPLCAQYFCGVPTIMPLIAPIFSDAGLNVSGSTVAILVGVCRLSSFTVASLVVEKLGRRPLLLFSTAGAIIPVTSLGMYFYLKYINSSLTSSVQWIPIVSVLSYIFIYSVGLGPLPNAMMGEFFPTDVRSKAISFMAAVAGTTLAAYSFGFPLFAEMVGIHWCMWIFGSLCLGSALLIYFYMPEIKGKSIFEIQEMLKNY